MFEIKTFSVNTLGENTYIVSDETRECVIIDCGAMFPDEEEAIKAYIADNSLTVKHHLLTHAHFDHVFGCPFISREYGVNPTLHRDDKHLYDSLDEQAKKYMGIELPIQLPPIQQLLLHDSKVSFGNHQLRVIHTPGHSRGSVFYVCDDEHVAFSGDTLFRASIGRTDLEEGSTPDILNSLQQKVAKIPWETKVYPGHGADTTIRIEMLSNPYLRGGIY